MKLLSFNIRFPNKADGDNYLPNRIPFIVRKLRTERPDVIGFQEIEELGTELLSNALPEYCFFGEGRNQDWSGEGSKIAILKDSMQLLAFDQIWLSSTPRIPASRFPDQSPCPRVALWAKLRHRVSGKSFYVVNTHLDHVGKEARFLGLQTIFALVSYLKEQEKLPVFVTGDFNFTPDEDPYRLIAQNQFSDLTERLKDTFHGFGKSETCKIDYILTDTSGEYTVKQWHECTNGIYLSDHDPVCLEWKI